MKELKMLVIHCTDTPAGRIVTPKDIITWHTAKPPVGRGWKQVGYSDMIMLDGKIINLVPYNEDKYVDPSEITNGAAGYNSLSRHVVYVGGRDGDTRTQSQIDSMTDYVFHFITKHPTCKIAGHNQLSSKLCPSFDVPRWLNYIKIPKENIYE